MSKKTDSEEKVSAILTNLAEFDSEGSRLSQSIADSTASISRLDRQSKEQAAALEQHKDGVFATLQDLAQKKNLADQHLRRRSELQARLSKDEENFQLQKRSLEQLSEQMESSLERNIELEKSLAILELESGADQEKRSGFATRVTVLNDSSRKIEKNLLSVKAKIDSLKEQSQNYESYGTGAQYVMKAISPSVHDEKLPKPLAEIIDCAPEYQQAVTSALQNHLGSIIVNNFTEALNIAERMKELQTGRVTLLSLESFSPENLQEIPEHDGGPVKLSDCVRSHKDFKGLIQELVHDYLVVKDLNQARDLALNSDVPANLVTLTGEIISNQRSVSVGNPEIPEKDVLFKKSELEALLTRSSSLETELKESSAELLELELKIQNLSTIIEDRKRREADLKIEQARLSKDIERLNSDKARCETRVREIELNRKRILNEIDSLEKEELVLQDKIKRLDDKRITLNEDQISFKDNLEKTRTLLSDETRKFNDSRIKLAQIQERKKSQERDLNRTRGFVRNCANELFALNQEAESLEKKLQTVSEEKLELLGRDKALSDRRDYLQATHGELEKSFNKLKPLIENLADEELSLAKTIELHSRQNPSEPG